MTQILSADRAMAEFFNNPFAYSRDHAMEIYEALEEIRNHTKLQLEGNNKSMARLGITIPQIVLDHVEDTIRGIELWMLVPGMVVNSERAETVDSIWAATTASRPSLAQALILISLIVGWLIWKLITNPLTVRFLFQSLGL